jgi:hypothetical protein
MKKGLKIILSCLIAASLLFASTGVVIASHICFKKGKSNVSFFENESCCSKHENSCSEVPVVKKKCCQLSISYHKLEVNSLTKPSSKVTGVFFIIPSSIILISDSVSLLNVAPPSAKYSDPLRLLPGSKNFLYSIRLLLI